VWAAVYLIYPLYPYSISRAELPDHPGLVALITHYCSGLSGVSRVMRAAISCPSWYSAFGVGPPDGRHGISEAQGRSQPGNRQAMPGRAGRAGRSPHTRGPDQSSSGACSHRGRGNFSRTADPRGNSFPDSLPLFIRYSPDSAATHWSVMNTCRKLLVSSDSHASAGDSDGQSPRH
jgi:hypothetical protein